MTALFTPATLCDQIATGMIAVDQNGVVRYVNSATERLLGKPRHRLLGESLDRLLPGHPLALDILTRAQKLAMPCRLRHARIHLGPMQELTLSLTACPLRTPTGDNVGAILQLEEVGTVERLEAGQRLNETLDSLSTMVMTVAHEVKNPLAGIRGAAQLVELECQHSATREYTQLIRTEVDRITRLLDRLLGLAEDHPLQLQETNIHEILNHVLDLAEQNPPKPQRDYDPSLPTLLGDRDALIQLFLNLVKNAQEAAGPRGTVRIHTRFAHAIRMAQGRRGHHVVVEVLDNGPGIPEEMQNRIFLPFVTTRKHGTGLGLAIAQKIINDHDGLVEVESHPGNTLFRVMLPMKKCD
ncbi:MAG: PAS domain-containing protein [Magnetococcales bacterium]|nr:PAS domain-containing protein [Magnetococcales bacterium]MBF0322079.1 PAS domain-containing protein [Magnetococcales bacterium]